MKRAPLFILGTILLVLFAVGAVQVYANKKAEEKVEEFFERFGLEEKSTYREVNYSLLSGTVEVSGLNLVTDEGSSHIDRLVIKKLTDTDIEVYAFGMRGEDKDFRKLEEQLRALGYDDVRMNTYVSLSLYEDTKELLVRKVGVEVPGAFRTEVSFKLTGIDREFINDLKELEGEGDDREKVARIANRLKRVYLNELSLKLTDHGFMNRLLEKEARDKKKSVEELKRDILRGIENSIAEDSSEFEKTLVEGVSRLIEHGGTLVLEAHPREPVSFENLVLYTLMALQTRDFSHFVKELNLKVKHQEV